MKNHKTTLSGLFLAILIAIKPIIETNEFDLQKNWQIYSMAVLIAIVSYFAKDHDSEE